MVRTSNIPHLGTKQAIVEFSPIARSGLSPLAQVWAAPNTKSPRGSNVTGLLNRSIVVARNFWAREEGQDLVEYALVVALVAFGAVFGMRWLSEQIGAVFTMLGGWVETARFWQF